MVGHCKGQQFSNFDTILPSFCPFSTMQCKLSIAVCGHKLHQLKANVSIQLIVGCTSTSPCNLYSSPFPPSSTALLLPSPTTSGHVGVFVAPGISAGFNREGEGETIPSD
jgi:hypothetical protein